MENGGKAVRYECTRCGACCRWAGDVCIETDEIREISRFLDMDEQVFIDTCCRLRANRRGLSIRDAEDGACMMLTKDGGRNAARFFSASGIIPWTGWNPAGILRFLQELSQIPFKTGIGRIDAFRIRHYGFSLCAESGHQEAHGDAVVPITG